VKRHRNDGLRKVCGCLRRSWAKCPHPWHFNFKWAGEHYRFSLDRQLGKPIRSKIEAKKEAESLRIAIRDGKFQAKDEPPPVTAPLTLRQLAAVYFERKVELERPERAQSERWQRDLILRTVLRHPSGQDVEFGDWPIEAITNDTLERFKEVRLANGRGTAGGRVAINRNLKFLSALFTWAIAPAGYLTRSPLKDPRGGTVTTVHTYKELPRRRRLEPGEETALLAACGPHLRAIVEAALETSCRKGELLSLQWKQVDWERNEIFLPAQKTKAKRDRWIPMSQRLRAILEMRRQDPAGKDMPGTAYVFGNEIGQRVRGFKRAWATAVLKAHGHKPTWTKGHLDATSRAAYDAIGLHFHDLRRESASRLLEGQVPEQYVQAVLGHADLSTTSRYLATTRKGLHQVMEQYEKRRKALQPSATESETGGHEQPQSARHETTSPR
jgi:integrase